MRKDSASSKHESLSADEIPCRETIGAASDTFPRDDRAVRRKKACQSELPFPVLYLKAKRHNNG